MSKLNLSQAYIDEILRMSDNYNIRDLKHLSVEELKSILDEVALKEIKRRSL